MASSITQAREGTLYLMCGGPREVFDRARPVLDALGKTVRYIGAAGEAAKVKALVNMVMNINTAGLAEGLGLGSALGLDLTMLRECFPRPARTAACSRPTARTCRTVPMTCSFPPRTPPRTAASPYRSRTGARPRPCRWLPRPNRNMTA